MAKKSFGLKNFFFSFVTVCVVIYIFQNSNGSVETMVAEKGNLEDIIKAKGIVVKDEDVFSANVDGNITYTHNDGDKVNKGLLVAELNTDSNTSQIKSQISELETAIELKNSGIKETVQVVDAVKNDEISQEDLQTSILNNDIDNIYKIQVNNNEALGISDNKYKDYDISQLESMKNSLLKSLGTNKVPYYSNRSGIITYKIDGLEDSYKYENVFGLTPSSTVQMDYVETDSSKNANVVNGDKLYKIISNFDYYIAATVNNEFAKLFEENKYIKTRVISDGSESEIWGYIKKINYGSEESVLIIYFDDYFYKIYDKRYVDLQLITDIHEGLKIDAKALCDKNGLNGVYIKDASNIVKFFPVLILGRDENIAIISAGDYISENQRRILIISENTYETIKIFDKVVLEPDKVYEGQIAK